MSEIQETGGPGRAAVGEPMPIWFFVGVILLVYGVLVVIGGFLPQERATVLAETRPSLWWGAVMTVAGVVFTAIGYLGRTR
jgi:drug/metabolite transporter (DMT)-like permease